MTGLESDILKALVLLASAPWWFPVAKHVVLDVIRVDDDIDPAPDRRPPGSDRTETSHTLRVSDLVDPRRAGLYNARWDIGRAPVRKPRSFGGRR